MKLQRLAVLLAAAASILVGAGSGSAGAVFTVTTTADSGPGSLRQAILDANANPGKDRIEFAIPGPGVHVIGPQTVLPPTTDPVVIDGSTQPGWGRFGPPLIEILGPGNFSGLGYPLATGLDIRGGKSAVMALAIGGFATGIVLQQAGKDSVVSSYVGVDPTGTTAIPNYKGIVVTGSDRDAIGGDSRFGIGNVISGNDTDGISVEGSNDAGVEQNLIGTTADGMSALPNGHSGIAVLGASDGSQLGTSGIGSNVVSGNTWNGIVLAPAQDGGDGPSHTAIQANLIGTAISGGAAVPNGGDGVFVEASDNLVGGSARRGEGNVISGNGLVGVMIDSLGKRNTIAGNLIGTSADGQSALPDNSGVWVAGTNNVVGTFTVLNAVKGATNVISSNFVGVIVEGNENAVGGNIIGRAADGTTPLGNTVGVWVILDAKRVTVGSEDDPNLIADNQDGVYLGGSDVSQTAISANSIVGNSFLGIDLGVTGVTPNDQGDPDTGPNGYQNFPVITGVTRNSKKLYVSGGLNSTPNGTYRVELFANAACGPLGHGQGKTYLGHTDVTTDGSGNATFTVSFPLAASAETPVVTATATDADGNTSEFSACSPGGG
jgi:titin